MPAKLASRVEEKIGKISLGQDTVFPPVRFIRKSAEIFCMDVTTQYIVHELNR
jgi:hypothetical protein